jgi:tetraacyldisaccharide 4'-kinase
LLFKGLVALRRAMYRHGVLKRQRLPVPVVVVGNITAGGTGKTPLVIYLAQALRARGRRPGIVSRGYRGESSRVMEVSATSDPAEVGDEPLLLVRRGGCPVFVGRDRVAAACALLETHPECDLIIADDGLQHYHLERDVEIATFDERGVMNGWPLPAGPLREPISRLTQVDAVVLNGDAVSPEPMPATAVFAMRLLGESFYRIDDTSTACNGADFAGRKLHAVAGIGSPQRFFDRLTGMGLDFSGHPFADHHDFSLEDLAFVGDAILTTEKDAVKLARLSLSLPVWVLPVTAELSPDLAEFVLEKLDGLASA